VILSCLTAPFRLLGLLVLVGIGYVAWTMRDDLRHWVHRVTADPPPPPAVGLTLEQVQATAMARLDSLRRRRADSVVLSQSEVESLLLPAVAQRSDGTLDSLALELGNDRVTVRGRMDLSRLPRSGLGPLAEYVRGPEPVEVRGEVLLRRVGLAEWRTDQVRIHGLPVPRVVWQRLVSLAAGRQNDPVSFPVPTWVGGLRVRPDGATLYGAGVKR